MEEFIDRLARLESGAVTATASVLLAVVTAVYVVLTGRLARHARASAQAAERSAAAAERALLLDLMPVVIPAPVPGATTVRLRNPSRSPALNVTVLTETSDHRLESVPLAYLGPGQDDLARFAGTARYQAWADMDQYKMTADYRDAAGTRYRVTRHAKPKEDYVSGASVERYQDGRWVALVMPEARIMVSFAELEVPDAPEPR